MNVSCDPHVNVRKILDQKALPFYDHLAFITMEHDFFFIIIAQGSIILNIQFSGSVHRTHEGTATVLCSCSGSRLIFFFLFF